ncbi:hypothetical protein RYX36_033336, partial [Vicia faba]
PEWRKILSILDEEMEPTYESMKSIDPISGLVKQNVEEASYMCRKKTEQPNMCIASWIVKFLLRRGYTVRATVRNIGNPNKVNHLLKLDGEKERLQLFKEDLIEEVSFDYVIHGCNDVFHAASSVDLVVDVSNPQTKLVDPVVKGTLNVLNSYLLREENMWYSYAKTSAEEAATKFLTENNIDHVVMNPDVTIGPLLQPELNQNYAFIFDFIIGSETFMNAILDVDVSLIWNSVGFYQIAKLSMILVSCFLESVLDNVRYSRDTKLNISIILLGVDLCTITDVCVNSKV